MPYDRVLVRLDQDDVVRVFVPTMPSVKGYIKEWTGDKHFQEVSLLVYQQTRQAPEGITQRKFKEYIRTAARKPSRIAARLPRDFQKGPQPGSFHIVKTDDLYVIEDSHKVLQYATPDKTQALARLKELTQGHPP